jgi:hypothetical protein
MRGKDPHYLELHFAPVCGAFFDIAQGTRLQLDQAIEHHDVNVVVFVKSPSVWCQ